MIAAIGVLIIVAVGILACAALLLIDDDWDDNFRWPM